MRHTRGGHLQRLAVGGVAPLFLAAAPAVIAAALAAVIVSEGE